MDDPHHARAPDQTPEGRLGAELRRLRVQAGLSVRQLASELHRAHSSIVGYESGRRLPGVEVVEQYEDYFGLSRGTLGAQRERARVQRLESPRDATVDGHLGDLACPYKGLRAFQYDDAARFFGREAQVQRVLARLAEVRFVAVVGASGSGKSSFVRAGLLASIGARSSNVGSRAPVVVLAPGEHPLDDLASAVSMVSGDGARVLGDDLRADPDRLGRVASHAGVGLVIVVDQFEELFTLCREEAERRCFVDALIGAWRDPASPVIVILALRADFYGRVAAYPQLAAAVVAHQVLIGPMSATDLRRAIELPAAANGLLLQPGLTDTMLEDLADEPGALPLLSHALFETWKRRQRLMLTVGGYREAGGVRGAIAQTAERTLQDLPDAERVIARSIFLALTEVAESSEPTRRRLDRAELPADPQTAQSRDRVLGILADARLVTIDERTVTVAHEALIRHWPRLRGWIDADRAGLLTHRRLTDAARQWDTHKREPAALYRGARLAAAREWATDHDDHLSQLERDFLTASHATEHNELEAAKRRTRRLRLLASGLAGLTVIVAALAVWALGQRSDAQRRGSDARRQTAQATSLALASAAVPLRNSQPHISLLLALEAYRASPRAEAKSSVLAALTATRDPRVLAIMHGHTRAVDHVAFSTDGRTLMSTSDDQTIRSWDARTHKQLGKPLSAHTSPVNSAAFSHDARTLAFSGADNTIRLWDTRTHKQRGAPLKGHSDYIRTMAFSRDGRTLASASNESKSPRTAPGALSATQLRTVPTAQTSSIRLWDLHTHKQLGAPLPGHAHSVHTVLFSPDGATLASAGDLSIRLWDVRTHKQLGAPLGRGGLSMAFSPDGRTLVFSAGKTIRFWDVRARKQLGPPLPAHTNRGVNGLAFSPDGRTLASIADKTVRLWDVRTHKQLGAPLSGHTSLVNSVAFSPDGRTLASASADETIRLWDVRTDKPPGTPLTRHSDTVFDVEFSPDGRTLASASADETIRLWDLRTHNQLGDPLSGHASLVDSVTFSPDGRTLASSGGKTLRLWDMRTHKQLGAPLTAHNDVSNVVFSPDGRTIAFDSVRLSVRGELRGAPTIRLWDVRAHKQLGKPLNGSGDSLAFSPDGRTLASGSQGGRVRLWDLRTHKPLGGPLTGGGLSVAFSPDGRTLASAGDDDGTIRLWDARTHKPLGAPLTGHEQYVYSIAFSPDGSTLASAGGEKTVRLWDLRTHRQLGEPLTGHTSGVFSVAFSPDGRTLASGGQDKTIQLWEKILWRNLRELQTEVCRLVGTGLSNTQWQQYAAAIPYRQSCP